MEFDTKRKPDLETENARYWAVKEGDEIPDGIEIEVNGQKTRLLGFTVVHDEDDQSKRVAFKITAETKTILRVCGGEARPDC